MPLLVWSRLYRRLTAADLIFPVPGSTATRPSAYELPMRSWLVTWFMAMSCIRGSSEVTIV